MMRANSLNNKINKAMVNNANTIDSFSDEEVQRLLAKRGRHTPAQSARYDLLVGLASTSPVPNHIFSILFNDTDSLVNVLSKYKRLPLEQVNKMLMPTTFRRITSEDLKHTFLLNVANFENTSQVFLKRIAAEASHVFPINERLCSVIGNIVRNPVCDKSVLKDTISHNVIDVLKKDPRFRPIIDSFYTIESVSKAHVPETEKIAE